MKIGICDDEACFIERTRDLLEQWGQQNNIAMTVLQFSNGDDLIQAQQTVCMDLILLDVIMPLLNGMDTARELRAKNQKVPIIFLTSSRDFAVDSYDVRAFHYLIKPVADSAFFKVMDDFYASLDKKKETFFARIAGGGCNITLEDAELLEAQNKEVVVYLSNGTQIEIRELFSECADIFTPDKGFFRCHRSYIVNMRYIEQFTKTQIITKSGIAIPVSRSNYVAFKETYFAYMFE